LRHVEIEGPGLLEIILKERGIEHKTIDATKQAIPQVDILIPMGGPMSANDNYEWLKAELAAIGNHVEAGGYLFGTCLGSQLLAKAIGGTVNPAGRREVGSYEAELTEGGGKDRLFSGLGSKLRVFHWHGETFSSLPKGAVVLAKGNWLNQAFRYKNAYGLQWHWEATEEMVKRWISADPFYVERVRKTPQKVMLDFQENMPSYRNNLQNVFGRFLQIATR
jgi:GMP synthase-like glutamine amidotransferase